MRGRFPVLVFHLRICFGVKALRMKQRLPALDKFTEPEHVLPPCRSVLLR